MRRVLLLPLALAALLGAPAVAQASQIVDRNVTAVSLGVTADGRTAVVSYAKAGTRKHVLAWGAMNALAASTARPQTKLKLDYTGGWGRFRQVEGYRKLRTTCGA